MRLFMVTFTRIAPGSVAIIGGGISGLVCAQRLLQQGVKRVAVFDTGRHGPGGRCSSRHLVIDGRDYVFDHSTQYFTVAHPRFQRVVQHLVKEGACRTWEDGVIGTLNGSTGKFNRLSRKIYIGVDSMSSIPKCLSRNVDVRCGVWVNEVHFDEVTRQWRLPRNESFDYIVIAHNGKCAARLMSTTPASDIHRALITRFGPVLPPNSRTMQLCSIWVLLVAFASPLRVPFHGAHVTDSDEISWIANNSAKYQDTGHLECWSVFSTREFGARYKAPQENIPPTKRRQVTDLLLSAFLRILKHFLKDDKAPVVRHTYVQLWGAAIPLNTVSKPSEGCLLDSMHQVGVCGDWLESPCFEGAAVSGLKLADRMVAHMKGDSTSILSSQLEFQSFPASEIGHFPCSETSDNS